MVVQVRLFAGLRERAGWSERDLDVADGASVADVWPLLELGERPGGLLYAVNLEYAGEDRVLQPGDEVALIPPVSGGAFRLTDVPIDPSAVVAEAADDRAGAIATFLGTTRVESRGRTVHYLDYEAYGGMAEKVMARARRRAEGEARALRGRDHPPRRPRRDRRGLGCDRRLGPAPRGGAGRLRRGDRHAQGDRPALEERGLRGRRGVDREGFLSDPRRLPSTYGAHGATPAGARTS